jgi:hypothetical protein
MLSLTFNPIRNPLHPLTLKLNRMWPHLTSRLTIKTPFENGTVNN